MLVKKKIKKKRRKIENKIFDELLGNENNFFLYI